MTYTFTGPGNGYAVGMKPLSEYERADEVRAYAAKHGLTLGQALIALVAQALDQEAE